MLELFYLKYIVLSIIIYKTNENLTEIDIINSDDHTTQFKVL